MKIVKWVAVSGLCYMCLTVNPAGAADPSLARKDLSTLTDAEIASLRKGTGKMMELDAGKPDLCPAGKPNDCISPLGWRYQAFIHGKATGDRVAWDSCQHSSWFFLSWHRMELYFFERVLRAMAGDPKLTLPYWNFSVPPAGMDPKTTGARLPAAYRVRPTATVANPLFWPARNAAVNKEPGPGGADTAMPLRYDDVTTLAAFSASAFFSNVEAMGGMTFGGGARQAEKHFGGVGKGRIERTPHDRVHGAVGNNTPTSMSNAYGAGLDPIFWPVHANVDRAWACWQEKHPGSEPKSDTWLKTTVFTFFDVEMKSGQPSPVARRMTGQEIIDTAKQLSYNYDNNCHGFELPVPAPAPAPKSLRAITDLSNSPENGGFGGNPVEIRSAILSPVLGAEPVTLSIPISGGLQERIASLVREGAPAGSIMLTIHDLAVDELTAAAYGIYLNAPEGAAPLRHSEHYVDELTFFGMGHTHRHDHDNEHAATPSQENSMIYDVTDVIRELIAKGKWRPDEVSVTLANDASATPDRASPPPAPAAARARFGYVSLTLN
jgi:tyrosinase